jgi:protease-4
MINFTPTISQLKMLAALRGNLWCINEGLAVQLALSALELSEKSTKGSYYSDDDLSDFYTLRKPMTVDSAGIAHIEVRGALLKEAQPIMERVGLAIRYSTIEAEMKAAIQSGAKGIIFKMNSPGGTVMGCVDCAEMIRDLPIPTMAYCDGLTCSAAYKLASGANWIAASKSAIVGNIGTILSWADCSQFWQKWGVNFKAIVSQGADLKSTFHLEPDEAQTTFLQESVNEAGKAFRDHVTAGREATGAFLSDEVWRAGWYSGETAGNLGLVDEIETYEMAYQNFLKNFL